MGILKSGWHDLTFQHMQFRENNLFLKTPVDSPFKKRCASIHQYSAHNPFFRKAPSNCVGIATDIVGICEPHSS